jgi:predicted ATPase
VAAVLCGLPAGTNAHAAQEEGDARRAPRQLGSSGTSAPLHRGTGHFSEVAVRVGSARGNRSRAPSYPLPTPVTALIGREHEQETICTLLRHAAVRLVTLTGTGGVGKTRLALQIATDLLDDFADGVFFVSLAPLNDPGLVLPTIAQTLGLHEAADRPLVEHVSGYLCNKHLLLLLDNFEQVATAAPLLTDLLAACPELKVLVTSRAVLHVSGEHAFPVSPLELPNLNQLPESEALLQYPAMALFLQRAQSLRPDFQLTAGNARPIAEICTHLDGLPLAIELAAARIKLLPPQALLRRLERPTGCATS